MGRAGHAYASGNRASALAVLAHLDGLSKIWSIAPYNRALIYAGLDDRDHAFEWLQRACEARSYLLAEYVNTDARLDNLHADPRCAELRHRQGLPTAH